MTKVDDTEGDDEGSQSYSVSFRSWDSSVCNPAVDEKGEGR